MHVLKEEFSGVSVVIRSAGERTLACCKKLILEQGVPGSQVFVVQEVPFSEAMRKSFQLGMREGRKWTLCIDADVLLRPGSIASLLAEAESKADNVCEIQGLVMDKYFGGPRPAGNHLYRTFLLDKVVENIPPEGFNIRPEHTTLQRMAGDGHPWVQVSLVIGTHDDEQYCRDIYRKCFVQGVKHLYLANMLIPIWKRGMQKDHDFLVALQGFSDSIRYSGELFINAKQTVYLDGFMNSGIAEKSEMDTGSFGLQDVENIILHWEETPEYQKHFPDSFGSRARKEALIEGGFIQRLRLFIREKGFFNSLFILVPLLIKKIGKRLARSR